MAEGGGGERSYRICCARVGLGVHRFPLALSAWQNMMLPRFSLYRELSQLRKASKRLDELRTFLPHDTWLKKMITHLCSFRRLSVIATTQEVAAVEIPQQRRPESSGLPSRAGCWLLCTYRVVHVVERYILLTFS